MLGGGYDLQDWIHITTWYASEDKKAGSEVKENRGELCKSHTFKTVSQVNNNVMSCVAHHPV